MRINKGLIIICLTMLSMNSGCISHRGVLDNNTYYSTKSPSLQVKIKDEFEYRKGESGQYQHQFLDNENHRLVYIHFTAHMPNETSVDYYENPDGWIYASIPDSVELERFNMHEAGEKWYVRDIVHHVSTVACLMIRDLGVFTDDHDVLKMLYLWQMPPYVCKDWKSKESLSEAQQQYLNEFRSGFSEDIKISKYIEKE